MGFIDAFKRWRLAQQGLSSGKKRRVQSANPFLSAIEDSIWVKLALYAFFIVATAFILFVSDKGAVFADDPFKAAAYGMILATTAVVMFHITLQSSCRSNSRAILVLGALFGHLMVVRLIMGLVNANHIPEIHRFFFVPYALAPMLLGILLGRPVGAFSAVYLSLVGSVLNPRIDALAYMVFSLACGITAVIAADQVRKRGQLLRAGLYTGIVAVVIGLLLGRIDVASLFGSDPIGQFQQIGTGCLAAVGTAVFTALLISGFLPFFEGAFRVTTNISWLELSDLNHKLLRQMQMEAPGTFHHSLIVAALAEAAAESIGANAQLCRVCSYFHDIGKLKKPGYFIENQHGEVENPHDTLTPTMSALIIIAHVKDGLDLAIKHKLNPRIIDVIREHHGDSLVAYFYRRAQEQKKEDLEKVDRKLENPEDLPAIDEKNFRYPGPRPSTRESGIIALADTIESASRTLTKPTPARIRALVEDLTRAKIHDGQLDNCPLTLKELTAAKESFTKTLRGMLHSRVSYPKDDDKSTISGSRRSQIDQESSQIGRVIPMPKRA
ncbi:MAG: HDIG domain-containing metalloprotein [Verrucomicrobiota bacterium]